MALTTNEAIGSTNILIVDSSICHAGEETPLLLPPPVPLLADIPRICSAGGSIPTAKRGDPPQRISLDWASSSVQNVISRALSMASVGAVTMMGMSDDGERGVL